MHAGIGEAVMHENYPSIEAIPIVQARRAFTGGTPSQRARLINSMARELGRSFDEVAPIYDQIYDQMAGTAKVVDFLPAFVLKNLRLHFRRMAD